MPRCRVRIERKRYVGLRSRWEYQMKPVEELLPRASCKDCLLDALPHGQLGTPVAAARVSTSFLRPVLVCDPPTPFRTCSGQTQHVNCDITAWMPFRMKPARPPFTVSGTIGRMPSTGRSRVLNLLRNESSLFPDFSYSTTKSLAFCHRKRRSPPNASFTNRVVSLTILCSLFCLRTPFPAVTLSPFTKDC